MTHYPTDSINALIFWIYMIFIQIPIILLHVAAVYYHWYKEYIAEGFNTKKYWDLQSRTNKSTFIRFEICNFLIFFDFLLLNFLMGGYYQLPFWRDHVLILAHVYMIFTFSPFVAIKVRRLHDGGYSGWWILCTLPIIVFGLFQSQDMFNLVIFLGWITLLIGLYCLNGDEKINTYGPNPSSPEAETVDDRLLRPSMEVSPAINLV
jgi:uncharacterized membrane protein YhaH (DUF805 family)